MSDEEITSKSARKRDARQLKALGIRLAELNDAQRSTLPLPDALANAIDAYRRISSHEAKRRQGQLIGQLMRGIDIAALEAALDDLARESAHARHAHHAAESWRERLIADDAALTDYVAQHPATDRTRLRALIRAARKSSGDPTAFRALFRHLRSDATAHAEDPDDSVPPTVT